MARMTDAELKRELARRKKARGKDEVIILRGSHAERFLAGDEDDDEDDEDDEDDDEEDTGGRRTRRYFK